jgi:UDP-glucose 4-epimerase
MGIAAANGPVTTYNVGSEDAIDVRGIADAICSELGFAGVEYTWTGGSGAGRGWVGDVRVMGLATDRLKATGWRPTTTSEGAVARAARDAFERMDRKPPKARAR